ncbi:hypothetical protein [Ensifer sp. LC163]|uniref:hypothetical protein n=1 Tax=Ensifer sp. LC163 TaxID=1120652 RepID=UPI000812FA32|nr:hypothetical protein [Ensifer sp. LC163]OCP34923.1 hypothetical protein BC360_29460 [Ensifer sp. LC163]
MKTIHHKVIFVGIAVFVVAGGGAAAGLGAASRLTQNVEVVTQDAQSLRNHMQADMMHDALRGDVLASLLARDPGAGSTSCNLLNCKQILIQFMIAYAKIPQNSHP